MLRFPSLRALPLLFLALAACNRESGHQYRQNSLSPAPAASSDAEAAETYSATDSVGGISGALSLDAPSRKIIKTADMRCRVADVYAATSHLEHLIASVGGQIAESNMENEPNDTRSLPYKPDSLRRLQSYTTTAHLTLRVPVVRLDSVLTDIAAQAAFIHSRNLQLQDVTLQYLGNDLKNRAQAENDAALRARRLARKSRDAVSAGEYTDQRDEQRIDRRIENMGILEQVTYATVKIDLYQPERIDQMIVADTDYLMKPTFGQQTLLALNGGWQLMKNLLLFLLQIWPLVLGISLLVILIKYRFGKRAQWRFAKVSGK